MFLDAVAVVGAEGLGEKYLFTEDKMELLGQTFQYGGAVADLFKGLEHQPVKVPVDQVVFIQKIPVKGLTGNAAAFGNLGHGNLVHRRVQHALLHGCGKLVFGFFLG